MFDSECEYLVLPQVWNGAIYSFRSLCLCRRQRRTCRLNIEIRHFADSLNRSKCVEYKQLVAFSCSRFSLFAVLIHICSPFNTKLIVTVPFTLSLYTCFILLLSILLLISCASNVSTLKTILFHLIFVIYVDI